MWFRRSKRTSSDPAGRERRSPNRTPVMIEALETRKLLAGVAPADFNGDDLTDILWRNYDTGQNAVWILGGTNNLVRQRTFLLPTAADTNWQIVGTGYFNADNVIDIVWHHATNGQNAIWYMANDGNGDATVRDHVTLLPTTVPTNNWEAAGVVDFNGDTVPDIVWRNATSGANAVWLMGGAEGAVRQSILSLPAAPDTSWVISGVGDFDSTGAPDIIFRNIAPLDGRVAVWHMNTDGTRSAVTQLPTAPNVAWLLSYAHDFDQDGDLDLLWRNISNGSNAFWIMDGAVRESVEPLAAAPDTDWQITGSQVL